MSLTLRNIIKSSHIAFFFFMMMAIHQLVFAQAITITAKLNPTQTTVGTQVVYTITLSSDGSMGNIAPQPPTITQASGFDNFNFIGTQQQTTIVNGRTTASVSYNYVFTPTIQGTFSIPPASVTQNGAIYKSSPVTLKVVSQMPAPGTGGNSNVLPPEIRDRVVGPRVPGNPELERSLSGTFFVLPTYDTLNINQGEQITVSYHLLIDEQALQDLQLNIGRIELGQIKPPAFSQFLKDEIYAVPQRLDSENKVIGKRTYKVAPLYSVALTPTKTGNLSIEPFTVQIYITPRAQRVSNDPFAMFDDLMGVRAMNAVEVIALSPKLDLSVTPLPSNGKPADFSGGVGQFTVSASVDRTEAKSNEDLINFNLKIEGQGDASAIQPPKFPAINGLHLLEEPKGEVTTRNDGQKRISTKSFDYLIRPTEPGSSQIPALEMSVYNPQLKKYESLKTSPLSLNITTGTLTLPTVPQNSTTQQTENPQIQQTANIDIAYIHTELIRRDSVPPQRMNIILLILSSTCALVLSTLPLVIKLSKRFCSNRKEKQSSANDTKKALANFCKTAKSQNKSQIAATVREIIFAYFAVILGQDKQSLTIEEIEFELSQIENFPPELSAKIRHMLDSLDTFQYSHVQTDDSSLAQWFATIGQLIEEVERYCHD